MVKTNSNSVRNWEHNWIEARWGGVDYRFTYRYDVEQKTRCIKNLIANRGRFPVNTAFSSNSTDM